MKPKLVLVPGAETLIISFDHRREHPVERGYLEYVLDAVDEQTKQKTSRLYLSDPTNTWYMGGADGCGTDYPSMCKFIREAIKNSKCKQVATVGESMGGYASLMAGSLIHANRVLAFSPLSFFTLKQADEIGERRWVPHMQQAAALNVPETFTDIRNCSFAKDARVTLAYGTRPEESEVDVISIDCYHALRIKLFQPKIRLSFHKGSGHIVTRFLHDQGRLVPFIADVLGRT